MAGVLKLLEILSELALYRFTEMTCGLCWVILKSNNHSIDSVYAGEVTFEYAFIDE
jgi:hypothetical protein